MVTMLYMPRIACTNIADMGNRKIRDSCMRLNYFLNNRKGAAIEAAPAENKSTMNSNNVNTINMKQSKTPTPFIMVRAYTISEWDNCDFVILEITDNWLVTLQERAAKLELFKQDTDFEAAGWFDWPLGFFVDPPEELAEVLSEEGWLFIETTDDEINKLARPENALDLHQIRIYAGGTFQYVANGKYSGEGFYTENISIEQLLRCMGK
jgi:hypothetical protein